MDVYQINYARDSSGSIKPVRYDALFTLHASVDGWGLFARGYPCFLLGCITKAISLDSVLAYICITQSDWLMDPSLPEKLNISKLLDSGDGADRTDGPTMHFASAPCKVNELRRRLEVVWTRRQACWSVDNDGHAIHHCFWSIFRNSVSSHSAFQTICETRTLVSGA